MFLPLKVNILILANSADPNDAAFHLGLHCLPVYNVIIAQINKGESAVIFKDKKQVTALHDIDENCPQSRISKDVSVSFFDDLSLGILECPSMSKYHGW